MKTFKTLISRPFYNLFAFLADRTSGWRIFVKPKLFFGAMLLGSLSLNSCEQPNEPPAAMCYDHAISISDTTQVQSE